MTFGGGCGCPRRAVMWEQSSGRGGGGPVRGEAGRASRKRHASRAEEVCGSGACVDRSAVDRERQGQACGIFLVKSHFFRRLP
jgi:hypothetical protein